MATLAHSQRMMMLALESGPAYLSPELFTGPAMRILAGMKVHANTISHARLVALEDTFPRTLALIGSDRFNALSRQYLEHHHLPAGPFSQTGAGFPRFLEMTGEDCAAADMARFEWLWLECYHAADAAPLALAELAGVDPADLMELRLARHPAARIDRFGRAFHRIMGREAPPLERAFAILIARPASQVLVTPASSLMARALSLIGKQASLGNLFAALCEPDRKDRADPDDLMQSIMSLLQAGALVQSD